MKNRLGSVAILLPLLFLLTACPKEKEIREMLADHVQKRNSAIMVLSKQDYSIDGLLTAQDYFFVFSERVHLMMIDEEARKGIRKMIKKQGARAFCGEFIVSTPYWGPLESFCSAGATYKCSPEMREYKTTLKKFRELAGDYQSALDSEPGCR